MRKVYEIEWSRGKPEGEISVLNGTLIGLRKLKDRGKIDGNRFASSKKGIFRLAVEVNINNVGGTSTSRL